VTIRETTLKMISVHPDDLIPTDHPRSLMGVLRFVPMLAHGRPVDPVVIIPQSDSREAPEPGDPTPPRYYVCSGNHRTAAAYVCDREISAMVMETPEDLDLVRQGRAAKCGTLLELEVSCWTESDAGHYLQGGWEEYLRMITDSGVVRFEESENPAPPGLFPLR